LTRHELQQLVAIWRDLKIGQTIEPMKRLQDLIANAAIDVVIEDMTNTALEQREGANHDDRRRSV